MATESEPPDRPPWGNGTLLRRLAPAVAHDLVRLGVRRRYTPGAPLIREGHRVPHVALLMDGIAKITAALPDGREALLAVRVAGDIVGEMSALNDTAPSATVTPCGPLLASVIRTGDFREFLKSHPAGALQLAGVVADRLRWANQRRIDFAAYPAVVRLARILAQLAETNGERNPHGLAIPVRLTQQHLATICGTATVTIQKALTELRHQELITKIGHTIVVRDLLSLRRVGHLQNG